MGAISVKTTKKSAKSLQANTSDKVPSSIRSIFSRENIEAILIAVVLALFIRTFVVQAFKIPSGSMLETIQLGDHILVNKFIYGIKIPFVQKTLVHIKDPQHNDIVVFEPPHEPEKDYIKRVIGVAGDVIEIRDKHLYRNGKRVTAPYEIHTDPTTYPRGVSPRDNFGPITVPKDHLFFMGDNRDASLDSRYWGFVHLDKIKGKAFMIYWSWDKEDFGVRWGRIGTMFN